ncbi:MAG: glycosyltransferase family 4 protein, partial [Acidobacteria bacterium]|nr:glycosyltransferase family 4 protein [Acidobacteriota bacterium]
IKDVRLELIYNGVDVAPFETAKARAANVRSMYDLPEGVKLVTLVANLRHDVKNVPMFLRAADRVSRIFQDVHFVIAGEGEMQADLEAMASRLGIEGMTYFIGRCDDVPALLAASDVCVLTSVAEGFSNSILEYMAAGKPVVATDVGGASEVVLEDETGFLVPSNDDEAMADRLLELLGDQRKASQMGRAGHDRVASEFSISKQLESALNLYRSLLAK